MALRTSAHISIVCCGLVGDVTVYSELIQEASDPETLFSAFRVLLVLLYLHPHKELLAEIPMVLSLQVRILWQSINLLYVSLSRSPAAVLPQVRGCAHVMSSRSLQDCVSKRKANAANVPAAVRRFDFLTMGTSAAR